ncbi:hypothetical protein CALCODRAFT_364553 [Calocera cornea HHB12733]|uniref:Uncharacterized protein n=1 Tax=Calocera cornea HHB12733 TaxID=1353952 RepID=A0A165J912_9BASI|nr:hypothetical protein CALCODRAFT_364553 [Calocera cornea HHB12733]
MEPKLPHKLFSASQRWHVSALACRCSLAVSPGSVHVNRAGGAVCLKQSWAKLHHQPNTSQAQRTPTPTSTSPTPPPTTDNRQPPPEHSTGHAPVPRCRARDSVHDRGLVDFNGLPLLSSLDFLAGALQRSALSSFMVDGMGWGRSQLRACSMAGQCPGGVPLSPNFKVDFLRSGWERRSPWNLSKRGGGGGGGGGGMYPVLCCLALPTFSGWS